MGVMGTKVRRLFGREATGKHSRGTLFQFRIRNMKPGGGSVTDWECL